MKLDFWKQIRRRDADECTSRQRHADTENRILMAAEQTEAGKKGDCAERHDGRIKPVDDSASADRYPGVDHQRADDGGVKRLVQ